MQRLYNRRRPTTVMVHHNQCTIDLLLGGSHVGFPRGALGYYERFSSNPFHLSNARIAILGSAHSEMAKAAERFESMFSLSTAALVRLSKQEKPTSRPKPRKQSVPHAPERLVTVRFNNWDCDIFVMINAYAQVRFRPAPIQSSTSATAEM